MRRRQCLLAEAGGHTGSGRFPDTCTDARAGAFTCPVAGSLAITHARSFAVAHADIGRPAFESCGAGDRREPYLRTSAELHALADFDGQQIRFRPRLQGR